MKRRIIALFSVICCVWVLFGSTASAEKLRVTRYKQEKSKWCWAACAQMIGAYMGHNATQSAICKAVKDKVVNEAASYNESLSAISYATKKTALFVGVASFNNCRKSIKGKKPFYIVFKYNLGNEAHSIVGAGIREKEGLLEEAIYIIDPLGDRESKFFPYYDLVNGTCLYAGKGKIDQVALQ